jgi:hypothetical protein
MTQNLHPKCANPACTAAFDWLAGGRLFRFHRGPQASVPNMTPVRSIEHFWLCEKCCSLFTIGFEKDRGVTLRLLWPELPCAQHPMELPLR